MLEYPQHDCNAPSELKINIVPSTTIQKITLTFFLMMKTITTRNRELCKCEQEIIATPGIKDGVLLYTISILTGNNPNSHILREKRSKERYSQYLYRLRNSAVKKSGLRSFERGHNLVSPCPSFFFTFEALVISFSILNCSP